MLRLILYPYAIVFIGYLIWEIANFIRSIKDLKKTSHFYNVRLDISDELLIKLEWHEIIDKIVSIQKEIRLCHNKFLDSLDITNRIMRRDNYMLAFVNKNILDFRAPWNVFGFKGWLCSTNNGCFWLCNNEAKHSNQDVLRYVH